MTTDSHGGYPVPRLWLRLAALCCLTAFLGGCGFHLRGAVHLPPQMNTTYIQGGNRFGILITSLRQSLKASGVSVVDKRENAGAVLRILSRGARQRVLSVDADGRPQESELYSSVSFDVVDANGRQLLAPQALDVRRDYLVSATDVLGTASDETFARQQMDRDLVRMMMMRLEALTR
ncbi:MAG: LPS assembly lipoprotein LptE [Gammaproteobacteria bacterium]